MLRLERNEKKIFATTTTTITDHMIGESFTDTTTKTPYSISCYLDYIMIPLPNQPKLKNFPVLLLEKGKAFLFMIALAISTKANNLI